MIENAMILPLLISNHMRTSNKIVETEALIDSGAAGNLIDFNYAKRNDLPIIDWKKGTMEWRLNLTRQRFWVGMKEKYEQQQRAIKAGISPQIAKEEKPRTVDDGIMPQKQRKNIRQYINVISHSIEFTVKYEEPDKQEKKPIEELVPPEYHKYLKVFSEQAANQLPERRAWDHKIDMKPDFIPKSSKIYPLNPEEE